MNVDKNYIAEHKSDSEHIIETKNSLIAEYSEKYKRNEIYRWQNIRLIIIFQVLNSTMVVMTLGQMYDTFVFLTFNNSNSWVGYLSTLNGITTLLFAWPAGELVDHKDKKLLSRITAIMMFLGSLLGISAMLTGNYIILFSYTFFMAIVQELGLSVTSTIFTESLTAKERLKYFPLRGSLFVGNIVGPFISIIFFLFVSNVWDIQTLRILLISSITVLYPTNIIIYLLLQNVDPSLISDIPPKDVHIGVVISSDANNNTNQNLDDTVYNELVELENPESTHIKSAQEEDEYRRKNLKGLSKYGPALNLATNFIRGMGAGMLVKYIPLFLISEYDFTPIQTSSSFILMGSSIFVGNFVFKYIAMVLGRPLTSFVSSLFAICALTGLGFSRHAILSVFCFVARGFFQNSIRHLDSSYMMDYIPADHRGKYNSILAFTNLAFGGTAFIGGYISDNISYRWTFFATAMVYCFSLCVFLPILFVLPASDKPKRINFSNFLKSFKKPPST